MSKSLDPDRLAELEREQDFLLRSLDDLDAEHEAGDLDAVDHDGLTDDYTRRLAEVARAIDEDRAARALADTRLSSRQRVLTIVGVVIVAVLAGVLLARASGFRSPTDSVSGDIRQSSTGLLAEADVLTREGRWEEALAVYSDVLEIAPANTEALTYRGWLTSRLGEGDGLVDLDEAISIDPQYPDARVFRAIVLDGQQRFEDAAADLAALDTLTAPDEMLALVERSGLRASVAGGQIVERFGTPGTPVELAEIAATPDDAAQAGLLLIDLDAELAIRVFDAVLGADPDNVTALVGTGFLQTQPQVIEVSPDTGRSGIEFFDRALVVSPGDDQILLFRALALAELGDTLDAAEDLASIDPEVLPDELRAAYDQLALRLG
ncbi:MAG: tetratricopeptide repeat protein [Actinomycetota bacterium]